jgi:hypothetical protein
VKHFAGMNVMMRNIVWRMNKMKECEHNWENIAIAKHEDGMYHLDVCTKCNMNQEEYCEECTWNNEEDEIQ